MSASTSTGELAQVVCNQPGLLRAVCMFNQSPADYIDESRREDFFPARTDAALWSCERSRRHLSRHILERLGAAPCLETHRPEWQVALLDRPRLDRLARHVCAALAGARVRRCLSRDEVLRWRDWLTPEAHEFALTRAGLLPFNADLGEGAGRLPPEQMGRAWLVAASRHWHESIARRFLLKLPAGPAPDVNAIDGALASRLVSSVVSIVEARWCSSFATIRS